MERKKVPPFQYLHRDGEKKTVLGWFQCIDAAFFSCESNANAYPDAPTKVNVQS